MAEESSINLESLEIVPLTKEALKGAFQLEDKESSNLVNWIKTAAVLSQREKKSKTYLAAYDGKFIAYVSLSAGLIDGIEGMPNATAHENQVLLIGKLYVAPDFRGAGVGSKLLSFTLDIAATMDEMVGCAGMLVDANRKGRVVDFYKKFGFIELDEDNAQRTTKMFFRLPTN